MLIKSYEKIRYCMVLVIYFNIINNILLILYLDFREELKCVCLLYF